MAGASASCGACTGDGTHAAHLGLAASAIGSMICGAARAVGSVAYNKQERNGDCQKMYMVSTLSNDPDQQLLTSADLRKSGLS